MFARWCLVEIEMEKGIDRVNSLMAGPSLVEENERICFFLPSSVVTRQQRKEILVRKLSFLPTFCDTCCSHQGFQFRYCKNFGHHRNYRILRNSAEISVKFFLETSTWSMLFLKKTFKSKQILVWFMTTHLLNTKICNINNKKLSLKLYNTCISVLQNFGFFFRPPPKLPNFVKFHRNFEPCSSHDFERGIQNV